MNRDLPDHIVLSRKGWDSKSGGCPSPILPDGTPVSLPIPDYDSGIRYHDVRLPDGRSVGPFVESLTRSRKKAIKRTDEVHLDPDLLAYSVQRDDFQAAFGQCGPSQSHLKNEGVKEGDLFLFFGLYRAVSDDGNSWTFARENAIHLIFGWLQIGKRIDLSAGVSVPNCAGHPHVIRSGIVKESLQKQPQNMLYLARPELSFSPELPGAGVFGRFDMSNITDPRRLTKPGQQQASRWSLPSFFSPPSRLSNMGDQPLARDGRWEPQRRGPGQEFVLNTSGIENAAQGWLTKLFQTATRKSRAAEAS